MVSWLPVLCLPIFGLMGADSQKDSTRLAPEPGVAAQKTAEDSLKRLLKDDFAAAKRDAAACVALTKKLLQYGLEEKRDLGLRYVCFREARDLASKTGDFQTALEAVSALGGTFEIDELLMKRAALDIAQRPVHSADAWKDLARKYAELASEALAADRYDFAMTLAADFASAAEKSKTPAVIAQANATKKEVKEIKAEYDRIEKERTALLQKPNDSQASLAVGKFLCLMKDDWKRGLPMLVRGADATFSTLGEMETANPREMGAQADLGDRWWQCAEAEKGPLKIRMLKRAAFWYEAALKGAKGLTRARIEKRLEDYGKAAAAAGLSPPTVYLASLKEEEVSVGYGVLGKNGELGYAIIGSPPITRALVQGKEVLNSLSLHPPERGVSYITYKVGGRYRALVAGAALADGYGQPAGTPLIFRVRGDGKVLWTSKPIGKPKLVEKCEVKLAGIQVLRLEVECRGTNTVAAALWVEPELLN
jgi:hypothetical protein